MFATKLAYPLSGGRVYAALQFIGLSSTQPHSFSQIASLSTPKALTVRSGKKRYPNAYMQYSMEQFKIIRQEKPGYSVGYYAKSISETWSSLSLEARQVYEDRALLAKQLAEEEYALLTEEEKAEHIAIKQMKLDKKHTHAVKKEKKNSGKPSKSRSSWNYYVKHNSVEKAITDPLYIKQLKDQFDALPLEEKQKYDAMSREDASRYEEEMKEWVNKVWNDGQDHLVSGRHKKKYLVL